MKALVVLIALALLLLAAWLVVRAVAVRGRRRALQRGRWSLEEGGDGERVTVHAVHPAHPPLLVGAVPIADPDFAQRLEDVRAEGEEKVVALNSRRVSPGR